MFAGKLFHMTGPDIRKNVWETRWLVLKQTVVVVWQNVNVQNE